MDNGRLQTVVSYVRRLARAQQNPENDRTLLRAFVDRGDQAAFATIVERHAGMVLGVCRRILLNHHEAEDAAQATFFVLARKAEQIPWGDSIAPWLSSVAYRVAIKARTLVSKMPTTALDPSASGAHPEADASRNELRNFLDEEIQRLPEKLRHPIILCCLEGRTYDQAAQDLGWRTTTLKGRLERARNLLRSRLESRSLLSGPGLPVPLLEGLLKPAAVPSQLAASISRIAILVRAGESALLGLVSARVFAFMACPVPGMSMTTSALLFTLILTVGASAVGGAVLVFRQQEAETGHPVQAARQTSLLSSQVAKADPTDAGPPATSSPPSRLDRFGDPLPEHAIGRLGTTRLRHGASIRFLRFTPDGKRLVSQAGDGVRIWNVDTAAQLGFIPPSAASLKPSRIDFETIEISADGKLLATPGATGVDIFELESGRRIRTIASGACSRTCISPSGSLLATVSGAEANVIELSDVATGQKLGSSKEAEGPITFLSFTSDGQTLVSANTAWQPPTGRLKNWITLWDAATGKERRRIATDRFGPSRVAISKNNRLAAICRTNMESRVLVWDMQTGNEMWHLDPLPPPNEPGRPVELNALTFLPNGKLLIAGRGDDLLVTWSPTSGMQTHKFSRELALAGVLAVSPDGKTLAANPSFGSSVRLIDWESGKVRFPEMSYTPVELAGVTAKGGTVVMRGGHRVSIWEPATGKTRILFERPDQVFWQVRLIPDGHKLQAWEISPGRVSAMAVSIWDLATGAELQTVQCAERMDGRLYPMALSPDGKTAAMLDPESHKTVLLMEASTRNILRGLTGDANALRATFTPDGNSLVVWSEQQSALYVWDTATGRRLNTIQFPGPESELPGRNCEPVISEDGQVVAVEAQNKSFSVFDLNTGKLVQKIKDLVDTPQVMALSHDKKLLAWSGKHNPMVAVVELATGRELHRFVGHEGKVTSLAFSSDNKMLVTHSEDTTTLAWDLTGRLMGGSAKK
jgi:RNA polymerase sigma factor (sigma-70 family)